VRGDARDFDDSLLTAAPHHIQGTPITDDSLRKPRPVPQNKKRHCGQNPPTVHPALNPYLTARSSLGELSSKSAGNARWRNRWHGHHLQSRSRPWGVGGG